MAYIQFFLGTPQRFLATLVALAAVMVFNYLNPGFIETLIQRFVREVVWPIACVALWIGIIYVGFRVMTRWLRR